MTRIYRLDLQVTYSAPVAWSRRILRVYPLQRANQSAGEVQVRIAPSPFRREMRCEQFGTQSLLLSHRKIESRFDFQLEFRGETVPAPLREPSADGVWKMPSRGVDFGGELAELAREVRTLNPALRARQIARLCEENLSYTAQNSPHPPRASAIWANKIGSCAEFAHVFIAICRQSGLPARYVSGFGAQNGALHAWAETYFEGAWHAFDPTLGRELSEGCFAVAVGRDFYDCAPHEGAFRGAASAHLKLWCANRAL